jgi:hypothetical protein
MPGPDQSPDPDALLDLSLAIAQYRAKELVTQHHWPAFALS